jgi:hypothetical protein
MQDIESREQEMLERLTTTFKQIAQTEAEITNLQKGSTKSNKTVANSQLNRKINAILSVSNSQGNSSNFSIASF